MAPSSTSRMRQEKACLSAKLVLEVSHCSMLAQLVCFRPQRSVVALIIEYSMMIIWGFRNTEYRTKYIAKKEDGKI